MYFVSTMNFVWTPAQGELHIAILTCHSSVYAVALADQHVSKNYTDELHSCNIEVSKICIVVELSE